ncbi:O-antigen ligase family protein [Micromonosporaceae bacterium Da 78-11]
MTELSAPGTPGLPHWPLVAAFGAVPLLWLSGGFYLAWPLLGLVLAALLLARGGRLGVPAGSGLAVVFCALATLSLSRLSSSGEMLVAGLRLGFYLTAFLIGLYVYTALREGQPWERVFRPLCLFWLGLVLLGWLGVLAPRLGSVSPLEALLPGGLAGNPFINDLVHLRTAEFNDSSLTPVYRPAAPFAYTNTWGSTWALAVPCVIAYLSSVRAGRLRPALLGSLVLSLPPAFLTLNRGMFVSLGAGVLVLALRGVARRQFKVVATLTVGVSLVGVMMLFIPVTQLIEARTSSSDTTMDRLGLYEQALILASEAPLLGYGGPVKVDTTTADAPVGTQGQFWQVLIAHGVPALVVFCGWFLAVARRVGRASSPGGQWLATVPVIGLVQLPFYGLTFHNLSVLCYAAGLAMAAVDSPVRRLAGAVR